MFLMKRSFRYSAKDEDCDETTCTIDYDYSPRQDRSSISVAEGTIGSSPQTVGTLHAFGAVTSDDSISKGGTIFRVHERRTKREESVGKIKAASSSIPHDTSRSSEMKNLLHGDSETCLSEKSFIIDVIAPPGKIGVILADDANSGPMKGPIVRTIKESSSMFDQMKVNDKMLAVDDEDVRSMTYQQVSNMISRKCANRTRKFTLFRVVERV